MYAAIIAEIGRLRYLLTGVPLAVLLGLLCRAFGKLIEPFSEWRIFHGICSEMKEENGCYVLQVQFSDARQLSHTAAFRTQHPDAAALQAGAPVKIALRTDVFTAGIYPADPKAAADADGTVLLYRAYRAQMVKRLLGTAIRQILLCGAALAVFLFAMHACFPNRR